GGLVVVDADTRLAGVLGQALDEEAGAIEYLSPPAAAERFPGDPILSTVPPYVAAVRLRVRDLDATRRFLNGAGIAGHEVPGHAPRVSSRDAMGAVLEFA